MTLLLNENYPVTLIPKTADTWHLQTTLEEKKQRNISSRGLLGCDVGVTT